MYETSDDDFRIGYLFVQFQSTFRSSSDLHNIVINLNANDNDECLDIQQIDKKLFQTYFSSFLSFKNTN